jgi:phosphopantothenoylcysteine decarboxylase/phosphopantothenate--cysteine ligase
MKNKKILVGITGSIAAYKAIILVRLLVKAGAEVKVIMTPSAKEFVSPLVLSVLSKNKIDIDWHEQYEWNNHVELGRCADVFVIAPLTCNTLSKMASGGCDNLLMAVYLSATCPTAVAPAMDEDMWHHPTVKENVEKIKEHKVKVIEVQKGELASGLFGDGRMAEPEEIFNFLKTTFFRSTRLLNKKVLVTAGPTFEAIDPVRYIGNRSSGKMGFAIAEAFYMQGADVVLVTGPTRETLSCSGITKIQVETAAEMLDYCEQHSNAAIIVMSAAVADYTPATVATEKIKKKETQLQLQLKKTEDILQHLGSQKKVGQYIAGFALETENEFANAVKKLKDKNADCIILNSLNDTGAGFEKDTNKISIISSMKTIQFELQSKKEVAENIVDFIISQVAK